MHEFHKAIEQMTRQQMDADIRAQFTRYDAARLTMWLAWGRALEHMDRVYHGQSYDPDRYASTTLVRLAVEQALRHAAKDPECAIWVHLPSGTLTAWPAFGAPCDWSWAMLEDFRDEDTVEKGWHERSYPERVSALLTTRDLRQEEWEATLYELRSDESMRTEWSQRNNQNYLADTAEKYES